MIADLFIKRPKFAIVIAILMMLAGGICLNQLPIAGIRKSRPPASTCRLPIRAPAPKW